MPIIGGAVALLLLLFVLTMQEDTTTIFAAKEEKNLEAVTAALALAPEPPNYERNPLKRIVIAAHYNEDTAWLNDLSKVSTVMLMGPAGLPANKGGEGMAYLTYIIDNYENLPESMMFVHGHAEGWHTEGPQMRRIMEIPCWNQVEYATITTYSYIGSNFILKGDCHPALQEQQQYTIQAWKENPGFEKLFNMTMPEDLLTPCCAQFLVHRKRVLARPRETYVKIRQWLIETPIETYFTGRVLEYTWHVSTTNVILASSSGSFAGGLETNREGSSQSLCMYMYVSVCVCTSVPPPSRELTPSLSLTTPPSSLHIIHLRTYPPTITHPCRSCSGSPRTRSTWKWTS